MLTTRLEIIPATFGGRGCALFLPVSLNLPKAKLKSNGLILLLVGEIPRHPNRVSIMWLLVITFMQIYNEKCGRKKYKIYSSRRKGF